MREFFRMLLRDKIGKPLTELERTANVSLAREIVTEAYYLLGGSDETLRFITPFKGIRIIAGEQVRISNIDLMIQICPYKGKFDTYIFYPYSVEKLRTRNKVNNNNRQEQVAEGEARPGDLSKLLKDIKASRPQPKE